jgi:hydroxylamine reductase (hybrid-cluster protein)
LNDLPIAYNIAWYEQKAVIVLLALLYLGVKDIKLGPILPRFLSTNVVNVLVENFGISGIGEVEEDMKNFEIISEEAVFKLGILFEFKILCQLKYRNRESLSLNFILLTSF